MTWGVASTQGRTQKEFLENQKGHWAKSCELSMKFTTEVEAYIPFGYSEESKVKSAKSLFKLSPKSEWQAMDDKKPCTSFIQLGKWTQVVCGT